MTHMNRAIRTVLTLFLLLSCATAARAQAVGNGNLYRWDGKAFVQENGFGVRVAVAPNGDAWVVNAAGEIYRRAGGEFRQITGGAKDIAVGGDGTVWVIGTDDKVYRWNRTTWDLVPGEGMAIAAGRRGDPWVVNRRGEIYHWNGKSFERQEGTARDVGAGNSVWVVGQENGLHELQRDGAFSQNRGTGVRVTVGANGAPWAVTANGDIYRWRGQAFEQVPGTATDIGANARGDVWAIGQLVTATTPAPDRPGRGRARGRQ